jgi:hypothetical protein
MEAAMTEAEWLACEEPAKMIESLPDKGERRDLRLFACACIRRFWHLIGDERVTKAVEIAERHAERAMKNRGPFIGDVYRATVDGRQEDGGVEGVAYLLASAAHDAICSYQQLPAWRPHVKCAAIAALSGGEDAGRAEERWQAAALRDIVAGPERLAPLSKALLTPTVRSLARAAFETRSASEGILDAARLGILADALEEAGCADERLLQHLRSAGPHVRGCWALDLVRGKR